MLIKLTNLQNYRYHLFVKVSKTFSTCKTSFDNAFSRISSRFRAFMDGFTHKLHYAIFFGSQTRFSKTTGYISSINIAVEVFPKIVSQLGAILVGFSEQKNGTRKLLVVACLYETSRQANWFFSKKPTSHCYNTQ